MGMCVGDCDSDSQCQAPYRCFQRSAFEEVPGCAGSGTEGWDYCFDPFTFGGGYAAGSTAAGVDLSADIDDLMAANAADDEHRAGLDFEGNAIETAADRLVASIGETCTTAATCLGTQKCARFGVSAKQCCDKTIVVKQQTCTGSGRYVSCTPAPDIEYCVAELGDGCPEADENTADSFQLGSHENCAGDLKCGDLGGTGMRCCKAADYQQRDDLLSYTGVGKYRQANYFKKDTCTRIDDGWAHAPDFACDRSVFVGSRRCKGGSTCSRMDSNSNNWMCCGTTIVEKDENNMAQNWCKVKENQICPSSGYQGCDAGTTCAYPTGKIDVFHCIDDVVMKDGKYYQRGHASARAPDPTPAPTPPPTYPTVNSGEVCGNAAHGLSTSAHCKGTDTCIFSQPGDSNMVCCPKWKVRQNGRMQTCDNPAPTPAPTKAEFELDVEKCCTEFHYRLQQFGMGVANSVREHCKGAFGSDCMPPTAAPTPAPTPAPTKPVWQTDVNKCCEAFHFRLQAYGFGVAGPMLEFCEKLGSNCAPPTAAPTPAPTPKPTRAVSAEEKTCCTEFHYRLQGWGMGAARQVLAHCQSIGGKDACSS